MVFSGDGEITNCAFVNCKGTSGGGISLAGNVIIEGCEFVSCLNNGLSAYGDPPHSVSNIAVRDCVFRENTNEGGANSALGAYGINDLLIESCVFEGNIGYNSPSAIGIGQSRFTIRGNLFLRNSSPGGLSGGGAIQAGANAGLQSIFESNTFYDCSKDFVSEISTASAISCDGPLFPPLILRNNVFTNCTGAMAVELYSGELVSSCNVFWQNPVGNANFPLDPSDRDIDPDFCDPLSDDFTVHTSSPCLPPNSLGCGLIGAFGEGCGSVSIERMTWGRIKNLYRGSEGPRSAP